MSKEMLGPSAFWKRQGNQKEDIIDAVVESLRSAYRRRFMVNQIA